MLYPCAFFSLRRSRNIVSVNPRAERFNIVSTNHRRVHKCDFSIFDRRHPFWAIWSKKLILIRRIQWQSTNSSTNSNTQNSMAVSTFSVFDGKHHFRQSWTKKNQNCQFQFKFGSNNNQNIENSIVVFTCFNCGLHCFRRETPFLGKFGPKTFNCQFQLKCGTKTNSNVNNSMVVFIFHILEGKQFFWASLVQNIKNVSLS